MKLAVDITFEQKQKLNRLPWGTQGPLLRVVVEEINLLIDRHGIKVASLILSKDFDLLKHIIDKGVKENDTRRSEEKP